MADAPKRPMKAPFPIGDLKVASLDLDLRNSRFPRDALSQQDALELMLNTAGDDCLAMMRDITQTGQLNSSDVPITVANGERFTVMEGNRRLTCIRIWHDVDLLSKDADIEREYKARFLRVIEASPYDAPVSIRATIAPSEADADHWIDRKHESGAGGAGTVQWGPAMKDRRLARRDPKTASRALAFTELVSAEFADDHDIMADLETVRTRRYSMIQRFVDRSVVRDMLGLDFHAGKMAFKHGAQETKEAIRSVLADFAQPKAESGRTWARELDTVEDFRIYLNGKQHLLPTRPLQDPVGPVESRESKASGVQSGTQDKARHQAIHQHPAAPTPAADATPQTRPPRPTAPTAFIFRGLLLDQFTNRIQEIVRQTSMLNIFTYSEVTAVLLRVILDLTAQQFLKSHGKTAERHLDKNIKTAIKIIEPTASDSLGLAETTSPLQKAFHETTPDSVRLIQYAVHDLHSGRTPSETKILADRYEPVLMAMNAKMGGTKIR